MFSGVAGLGSGENDGEDGSGTKEQSFLQLLTTEDNSLERSGVCGNDSQLDLVDWLSSPERRASNASVLM